MNRAPLVPWERRGRRRTAKRRFDALLDRREVVAALEEEPEPSARVGLRHLAQPRRHPTVVPGLELHAGQRVPGVGVEACGHEEKVRARLVEHRQDDALEGLGVEGAVACRGERQVQRRARGVSAADLRDPSAVGVQRGLMERDEEHRRIAPEDVLGSVAVVHVPVDDGDASRSHRAGLRRRHRDVVEQAEAHRAGTHGVVPRRSREQHADVRRAVHERRRELHRAARREHRRRVAARTEIGVGVELSARTASVEVGEVVEVRGVVHAQQRLPRGRRRDGALLGAARLRDRSSASQRRLQARRTLGVIAACVVFLEPWIGPERELHGTFGGSGHRDAGPRSES